MLVVRWSGEPSDSWAAAAAEALAVVQRLIALRAGQESEGLTGRRESASPQTQPPEEQKELTHQAVARSKEQGWMEAQAQMRR